MVQRDVAGAPRQIVLVGLPGSGKSTVGSLLAERLGWSFVDLDDEIARRARRSIAEIFAQEGEPGFRSREREATSAIRDRDRVVIATGGGWAANAGAMESLDTGAILVWLIASAQVAAGRLSLSAYLGRPLLEGIPLAKGIAHLLTDRELQYARAPLHVVTDDRTPDQVVRELLGRLGDGVTLTAQSG